MSKIIKYITMQEVPVLIDSEFVIEQTVVPVVDDGVSEAIEQAANIVSQAKYTAQQSLNDACQEAIKIKQQAHDEGHQQGYQLGQQEGFIQGQNDGIAQGQQMGRTEMEQVLANAVAKSREILDASEHEVKEMMLAAERQLVEMALAIARKIIAYEIAENPMVVLPLVKAALQKVSDQEEVVIRVSVDDFDAVLMAKKDLQTMVGKENSLKIIVDHTIASGSCIIDSSYGEVDARIDTQFEIIKKVLQGVA